MLDLHLSYQQSYCLLRCHLYQRFYGRIHVTMRMAVTSHKTKPWCQESKGPNISVSARLLEFQVPLLWNSVIIDLKGNIKWDLTRQMFQVPCTFSKSFSIREPGKYLSWNILLLWNLASVEAAMQKSVEFREGRKLLNCQHQNLGFVALWDHITYGNIYLGPISIFDKMSYCNTVKLVYNDHLMGYFSAFWSSSRWPRATYMSSRRQKLLARVNWYLQSSLKHITE